MIEVYVETTVGLTTFQNRVSMAGRALVVSENEPIAIEPPVPLATGAVLVIYKDGVLAARFQERDGVAKAAPGLLEDRLRADPVAFGTLMMADPDAWDRASNRSYPCEFYFHFRDRPVSVITGLAA